MKQHLSHSPHQWSSRRVGVDVKGPVAAAERPVVLGQLREPLPHPQLGPVAQRGEVVGQARRAGLEQLAEARLERRRLGPLVVDLPPVVLERRHRGRPLVGHHHRVPAVEHRREHGDRGDDPGHRHVPVQEAELRRPQQLRVDLPPGPQHRQPAHGGRLLDRGEPVPRPAHHEQRDVAVPLPHALDGHDRVDAAAKGDERPQRAAAAQPGWQSAGAWAQQRALSGAGGRGAASAGAAGVA